MNTREKAEKIGTTLSRWAHRQAVSQLAELYSADCDGKAASGRARSDEWEVTVFVRSLHLVAAENADLSPIQRRILDVIGEEPMPQKVIAERIESEDGEYLYKALRGLYKLGRLVGHVKGWAKFT